MLIRLHLTNGCNLEIKNKEINYDDFIQVYTSDKCNYIEVGKFVIFKDKVIMIENMEDK